MKQPAYLLSLAATLTILSACGGGGSTTPPPDTTPIARIIVPAGRPPFTGQPITLDGTSSHAGANQTTLTYKWIVAPQPESPLSAQMLTPTQSRSNFVAFLRGTYQTTLVVNNGVMDSLPATASLTVCEREMNVPYRAENGLDVTITGIVPGSGGKEVTVNYSISREKGPDPKEIAEGGMRFWIEADGPQQQIGTKSLSSGDTVEGSFTFDAGDAKTMVFEYIPSSSTIPTHPATGSLQWVYAIK